MGDVVGDFSGEGVGVGRRVGSFVGLRVGRFVSWVGNIDGPAVGGIVGTVPIVATQTLPLKRLSPGPPTAKNSPSAESATENPVKRRRLLCARGANAVVRDSIILSYFWAFYLDKYPCRCILCPQTFYSCPAERISLDP